MLQEPDDRLIKGRGALPHRKMPGSRDDLERGLWQISMELLTHRQWQCRIMFSPEDEGSGLDAGEIQADIHTAERPQRLDQSYRPSPQGIRAEHRQEPQRQMREPAHQVPCLT